MNVEAERYLWERIPVNRGQRPSWEPGHSVRDVINQMVDKGIIRNHKQAWATLIKWGRYYEYGVCLDLGWRYPGEGPPPRLR